MENFLRRNGLFIFLLALAAFITGMAVSAFGADAAAVSASVNPWWVDLLTTLILTFGAAISAALALGIRMFFPWLKTKVDNSYLKDVIERSGPIAEELADDAFKNIIGPLKKQGEWNDEAKADIKKNVRDQLKGLISTDGLKKLLKILGTPDAVDALVGGLVERAVSTRKIAGRQAKSLKKTPGMLVPTADPSAS